jgi:hypothetical protein
MHGVNNVRQTEMHTGKALVPGPNLNETEAATEKFKMYKLQDTNQILAEVI